MVCTCLENCVERSVARPVSDVAKKRSSKNATNVEDGRDEAYGWVHREMVQQFLLKAHSDLRNFLCKTQ